MNAFTVRLSCEQCQRRKTKCDKKVPCTTCKSAELSCIAVQRTRRPRERSGKSKTIILKTRLARIEGLVKQLEVHISVIGSKIESLILKGQAQLPSDCDETNVNSLPNEAISVPSGRLSSKLNQFIAQDFWTALSQEVNQCFSYLSVKD